MLVDDLAATSEELTATSSRAAKVQHLAELLRAAQPAELAVVVSWLSGVLTQRQIGIGWASLREIPPAADEASLGVLEVEATFTTIGEASGAGSQLARRGLLAELLSRATAREQRFLGGLLTGGLRQGALVGVMTDAVARAAGLPLADVRRAAMLRGDLPSVAVAAVAGGAAALQQFGLEVGRPIGPMLAQTASSVADALSRFDGPAAVEWKLDGIRVQLHRRGDEVRVFTRTLDDITARMPEIVDTVRSFGGGDLVADGEVIALAEGGRPRPFQVTSSRVGSRGTTTAAQAALSVFVFDVMHADGRDLLDDPARLRADVLAELVPDNQRVPRLVTDDPEVAESFLAGALELGHEGVVVKSLAAPYEAGRRGAGWLKVKPVHTLDLVVLAVEWGSGRRRGLLSNIHLGARDPESGGFVMLGKTFKGMTDEMLRWQTERFRQLADGPTTEWVVPLRPEQVVEIAFDGVQKSSRYPGGLALRFARVVRYRDDKSAADIDTIGTVRAFAHE